MMYTIGQVAKFLGVTRDTLKYYEEKELVKPIKNTENGYRLYHHFDIYDVATVNFYRELELEIKAIQTLKKGQSVSDIQSLLEEKEQAIDEEIAYQKLILKKVQVAQENCRKIKTHVGRIVIKEMPPIEIKAEMKHFTSYEEYDLLQKHADHLKKAVSLTSLMRSITFDDTGIRQEQFLIVKEVEKKDAKTVKNVISHPKCLYTVIEDGRWSTGGECIDDQVEKLLRDTAAKNGYILLGQVYIQLLLVTYEDELERVFLELYVPIQ